MNTALRGEGVFLIMDDTYHSSDVHDAKIITTRMLVDRWFDRA